MQATQPHGFFQTAQQRSEDTAEARARRRLLDFIRVPHTGRSARDAWRLGFRGLMELYEENYRMFQRLLPQLEAAVGAQLTLPG
ncbi:MAG: hypothetical protein ACO376_07200, partial [Gammaproteobacteria bacterium]